MNDIVWKACPGCGDQFHGDEELCCCCRDDHNYPGMESFEEDVAAPFVGCLCPYTCPAHTPGVG